MLLDATDNTRLNFIDSGDGTPFVFQHGLGGDEKQPAEVFPAGPFRRLTLECRGHGLSEPGPSTGFSIAQFADDVARMIEMRADGPVVLGGISMGAAISLRLAVVRPDLVKGLVLARPAWLFDVNPTNMAPNAYVGQVLARSAGEVGLREFNESDIALVLEKQSPDNLASLRGFFARTNQPWLSTLLQKISADGPGVTKAQVARLKIPAMVIGTTLDHIHPLEYARMLSAIIPAAELVQVPPKSLAKEPYVRSFEAALRNFLHRF